jgi:hypothetical protein
MSYSLLETSDGVRERTRCENDAMCGAFPVREITKFRGTCSGVAIS